MRVESVGHHNKHSFVEYCSNYGREHDESYLPSDNFIVSLDQPSYLLLDESKVTGAASLIRTPSYIDAKKGRFAIFHSLDPSFTRYSKLYQAISQHFDGLDKVYLFIPQEKLDAVAALIRLGFQQERLSFVLCHRELRRRIVELKGRFTISSVRQNETTVEDFGAVLNDNFRESAGHIEKTVDDVRSWFDKETYIEEGIALLNCEEVPVGTVCIFREVGSASGVIEYLSVREGFRSKGLGRNLLRHGINVAIADGLKTIYLSVNGINDSAISLYLSEGFMLEETIVCFSKKAPYSV
ncbi:GNAT family N-acetyltransferase [Chloroflexota bacterium]